MGTEATKPSARCASCGATLAGPWCSACGERARKPGEVTLHEYLSEFVEALTNLEGRFWGSLRALVFKPGHLSREYMAGRRVKWMRPLHLFLLINLLYFFLSTWNTFSTPLFVHMTSTNFPHQAVAERLVNEHLNQPALEMEAWRRIMHQMYWTDPDLGEEQLRIHQRLREFSGQFNRRVEIYSRTLIIVLIPLLTLLPMLALVRRRDGPVKHLIFATHYASFFLLLNLVVGSGASAAAILNLIPADDALLDLVFSIISVCILLPWGLLAFRRTYDLAWPWAILCAVLLIAWLVMALNLYRALLFFVVFWTM